MCFCPTDVFAQQPLYQVDQSGHVASGGSTPQHLRRHDPIASTVVRAYNGDLGQSPQRGPGAEPLVKGPLKLKHFWFLDAQWRPQICPVFYNLEMRYTLFVLTLQKNYGWPRNWGGRSWSKTGVCVPPART